MKTWVYIDHFKGEAVSASWEALGAAKELGSVEKGIIPVRIEPI